MEGASERYDDSGRRVDQEIGKGNSVSTEYALSFLNAVGSKKYLSTRAKKYLLGPLIKKLSENLDTFNIENDCVTELSKYAGYIPRELLFDYVNAITQTYVGHTGGSAYFARTDFYANGAAVKIPTMFEKFDDESAQFFVEAVKTNPILQSRIENKVKLNRLRTLGEIVNRRISENFSEAEFLQALLDEKREREFFGLLNKRHKSY